MLCSPIHTWLEIVWLLEYAFWTRSRLNVVVSALGMLYRKTGIECWQHRLLENLWNKMTMCLVGDVLIVKRVFCYLCWTKLGYFESSCGLCGNLHFVIPFSPKKNVLCMHHQMFSSRFDHTYVNLIDIAWKESGYRWKGTRGECWYAFHDVHFSLK